MWLCCCSCALIVASLPPFLGDGFLFFIFFARRIRVNTSRTNRFFKFFLDFDDAIAWPNDSDFQAIAYFNVQQLLSLVMFPHDRSIFFLALTGAQLYNTIQPATVPGCRFLTQMRCWTKRLVCSFLVRFIH
jgi:hypothetical protein